MEGARILHVEMLGDFLVYTGSREKAADIFTVPMLRNRSIKALHFLALLLHQRGRMFERTKILTDIYGEDYGDTADNNLRAMIFRLRRLLDEMGLDGSAHLVSRRGLCGWEDGALEVKVDAEEFEKAAKKALKCGREEELRTALNWYRGNFLPFLESESWVVREDYRYRALYRRCVQSYCRLLEQGGRREEALACCWEAAEKCPDEEWYLYQAQIYLTEQKPELAGKMKEQGSRKPSCCGRERFLEICQVLNEIQERKKVPNVYVLCKLMGGGERFLLRSMRCLKRPFFPEFAVLT